MQMEYMTLTYPDALAMLRDLKAIGATNAARGRARGLMGRGRWQRALAALDASRGRAAGARVGDLRGHLRARVEGGADAHGRGPRDREARAQATHMSAAG